MFTRMILFCESEGARTKLWHNDSTVASIHHALKHTFWADGHNLCLTWLWKGQALPSPHSCFCLEELQMTEKKADSPGVLSVYRCVIYDHLWALDVALAPVLGSKGCSRILQAFLTSVFVPSGLAYTCLHRKYSFAGGYLHRTTWPDFAVDWQGSEKWVYFLLLVF